MKLNCKTLSFLIFTLAINLPINAQDNLLGDWAGLKTSLENNGITAESVIAVDTLSNVSGGIDEGSATLGNFDLMFTVDTEKAGLWKKGTFFFYGLGNFGDSISELVGDLQVTSNIEAYGTFKLYEAWYEHSLTDSLTFLFGLHDYNSEFYALEHSAGLINSSFGTGVDTAQVGPSIFSTTSLATRIKYLPSESSYLLLAAYDGIPGSPSDQVGTQVSFDSNDGIFYASEIGLVGSEDNYFKVGLGAWYHTTDYTDYQEQDRTSNFGGYFIAEKNITEKFGTFLQFGMTDEDKNQLENYLGLGFSYSGPFASRADDLLSFGIAHARNGSKFKDLNGVDSHETAFELNYRLQAAPFLAITPDVQYIVNPGTDKAIKDAVVIGFRTEVSL